MASDENWFADYDAGKGFGYRVSRTVRHSFAICALVLVSAACVRPRPASPVPAVEPPVESERTDAANDAPGECFVIGSDAAPGEKPVFHIPRQKVCPFVTIAPKRETQK